jgi:Family of unknown function (DUF5677)
MRILEDALEKVIQDVPGQFLSRIIQKKLASKGIAIRADECLELTKKALNGDTDDIRLRDLELTEQDQSEVDKKISEFLDTQLTTLVNSTSDEVAEKVFAVLRSKWKKESKAQSKELRGFTKRLHARWQKPLESLQILITICVELGTDINSILRNASDSHNTYRYDVLTRLHARACQISDEVLWMLAGGFADGAMARWRTLHEVAVVLLLIASGPEELAERYKLHEIVESRRAALEYEKCQQRLGYEPIELKDLQELERLLQQRHQPIWSRV